MRYDLDVADLEGVHVRPFEAADAPSLAHHADNPSVARFLRERFPSPYTVADAEAWIAHCREADPPTVLVIATPDQAIGCIGIEVAGDVHRYTGELGYWLGEAFWGRGIVTAAVAAMVRHGFDTLGLHRIFANVYVGNDASEVVLQRNGFVLEGRMRASVVKEGRVRDQSLYAVIAPGIEHGTEVVT